MTTETSDGLACAVANYDDNRLEHSDSGLNISTI